jgi:hypothetical protein
MSAIRSSGGPLSSTDERRTIERGWYYVREAPERVADGCVPADRLIRADDGAWLTRRLHGHPGVAVVTDATDDGVPVAASLRAAGALGRALETRGVVGVRYDVTLVEAGELRLQTRGARWELIVPRASLVARGHHALEDAVVALIADTAPPSDVVTQGLGALPARPTARALFFESLMNTDMPHNDKEISQGVLHMISSLSKTGTEVVLVNAKMPITGELRPVHGLDKLAEALAGPPVGLVGITLLEGYWEGVERLIAAIRGLGCRAHIAVGGVMPTLAPEHVAAHLQDVTFVCRGAGEVFLPRLAEIVGETDVDTPFGPAQIEALAGVDGMITVDRAGRRLVSARSDRTRQVEALDRVPLDLSYVEPRHVEGGVELSTSRGCVHRCSFCSILGRESYQARSAGSIFDVLGQYEARFAELEAQGHRLGPDRFRLHTSDDDFACDRDRARAFFEGLDGTPWRISSIQVSIADLCVKQQGRLTLEPDHALLDAMKAERFADHHRAIPRTDFFEDHATRTWSSFLQIGVETYSDREIARLGKGYKLAHVRLICAELARRRLHMDGYFILSNAETSAEDLVDVFTEVSRLKLRFPEFFHMRFPVVQHLVSYFTSASHRRHVRLGRSHVMKLRGLAAVPGFGELDYPFVDHDEPEDAIVADTVARAFVTDDGLYTGNLVVLRGLWMERLLALPADHADVGRLRDLLRRLDDRPRRLVLELLGQALSGDDTGWPGARLDPALALEAAERVLGPQSGWIGALKQVVRFGSTRRVVLVADGAWTEARVADALTFARASDARHLELHTVGDWSAHADALARAVAEDTRAGCADHSVRWLSEAAAPAPAERLWVDDGQSLAPRGAVRVLRLGPTSDVGAAVQRAAAGGPGAVAVEWEAPFSAADLGRLPAALFAAAPAMRAAGVRLVEAGAQRSGRGQDIAVFADGTVGRWDGPGGRPSVVLAHLDALTNPDRHALELADRSLSPDGADARARRLAGPAKVLRSFLQWFDGPGVAAPAPQP